MSRIAIYMEGGGDGRDTRAALRQGMDAFLTELKDAVRAKAWHWKLVCCGGRQEAFNAFSHARRTDDFGIIVLLVDAEGSVFKSPGVHLVERDGWVLDNVSDDFVHLMIQSMESWIVADAAALTTYYGQGFSAKRLPKSRNLEPVARDDIATALAAATSKTQKGTYHKIRHASDLLNLIDPQKVRRRCPSCNRLFVTVAALLAGP